MNRLFIALMLMIPYTVFGWGVIDIDFFAPEIEDWLNKK